ncbi:hypothetical protein D3C80_1960770 [compost metagenome]
MGVVLPNSETFCSSKVDGISGVQIGPGATALTRMPFPMSCADKERVKVTIAPLVAE